MPITFNNNDFTPEQQQEIRDRYNSTYQGANMNNLASKNLEFNNWLSSYSQQNELNKAEDKFKNIYSDSFNNMKNIEGILQGVLKNGLPYADELRQNLQGGINKSFDRTSEQINQSMADKGTYGSGANLALQMGLGGERAGAIANSELQVNQMKSDYLFRTIGSLLGLDQSQFQNQMGIQDSIFDRKKWEDQMGFNWAQLNEQQRQFNEQNDFSFGDFFGGILGTGLGAFTGGVAGKFADSLFGED